MTARSVTFLVGCFVGAVAAVSPVVAQETDALVGVRSLYQAAAYEDALAELGKLPPVPAQTARVEEFRAFCLFALGRTSEATDAVARAVTADPQLMPAANDASPRVLTFFSDVRQKALPSLARATYADAKAAMTANDTATALSGFTRVVAEIDSLGDLADSDLKDLRVLAAGFRDLELTRTPTAPGAPAPIPAAKPPAAAPAASVSTPATVISQAFPNWPYGQMSGTKSGVVHVTISPTGSVTSAVIAQTTDLRYDQQVLVAARGWKYHPAVLDGKPVSSERDITYVVGKH
jgi:TonB family protein